MGARVFGSVQVWDQVHPDGQGAGKVTTQHIAFWMEDSVNITRFVEQMKQASGYNGRYQASGPYRSPWSESFNKQKTLSK